MAGSQDFWFTYIDCFKGGSFMPALGCSHAPATFRPFLHYHFLVPLSKFCRVCIMLSHIVTIAFLESFSSIAWRAKLFLVPFRTWVGSPDCTRWWQSFCSGDSNLDAPSSYSFPLFFRGSAQLTGAPKERLIEGLISHDHKLRIWQSRKWFCEEGRP